MMPIVALLFPLAGLLLSVLLLIIVLYATTFRAAHGMIQRIGCLVCQPAQTVPTRNVTTVKSIKMQGLQVEAGSTTILVPDPKMHQHQQEVIALFEKYGSSNPNVYTAYSNAEMEVFLAPGVGCLLYTVARHWCRTVVCATGDPLCAANNTQLMLQLFRRAFPSAIFIDLSKSVSQVLVDEGGVVANDLGNETYIYVQKFHFEFNKKTKHIRRRAEVAAKAGLVVEELTADGSPQMREEVAQMAAEWQSGKVCSDDIKVFSRALPFEHLGRERGVRVFIARTLNPDEPPPAHGAMAAALLAKQAAAAAAATAAQEEPDTVAPLSRKQRKLRERIQRAKSLRAASATDTAAAADRLVNPHNQAACRQQQHGAVIQTTETLDITIQITDEQGQQNPCVASKLAAAKTGALIVEIPDTVVVSCGPSTPSSGNISTSSSGSVPCPSASSSRQYSAFMVDSAGSKKASAISMHDAASGPKIHACVVLDPIYDNGKIIGYTAERSFLHPKGVKGAVKLIQREALALLKAEGRQILNLGLAVGYEVKSGPHHGFRDCAWLTRTFHLCYEYGNDLYAFKNLAGAKASYGGGYKPETDRYKFSEAVELRRKFGVLPASWSWPLGDGVFATTVMFRHFGVLGDPWELFAFWKFMQPKKAGNAADCE